VLFPGLNRTVTEVPSSKSSTTQRFSHCPPAHKTYKPYNVLSECSNKVSGQKDFFRRIDIGTDETRFWIMTWGSKSAALETEALRQGIRSEAEKTAKPYEAPIAAQESQSNGGRTQDHLLQRS